MVHCQSTANCVGSLPRGPRNASSKPSPADSLYRRWQSGLILLPGRAQSLIFRGANQPQFRSAKGSVRRLAGRTTVLSTRCHLRNQCRSSLGMGRRVRSNLASASAGSSCDRFPIPRRSTRRALVEGPKGGTIRCHVARGSRRLRETSTNNDVPGGIIGPGLPDPGCPAHSCPT